jgi:aldehyde dehydrogenase (NAD+)
MHTAKRLERRSEPIAHRKERLRRLRKWVHENRPAIREAGFRDFRKPDVEVDAVEVLHVLSEVSFALDNLEQWTRPKKVDATLAMMGTRSSVYYEPKGVCLVIAPWNYPFCLCVGPLVSALAAGNSVIVKPSEHTPHMSVLIERMVKELFDPDLVTVVTGGPEISTQLLEFPFDHIFFTGSPAIGKIVMKAAAEHLTSVTLELGGKSPAIVGKDADLKRAAQRIAFAKFFNNGQTCIAPDYVLADQVIAKELTVQIKEQVNALFAERKSFETSTSYARIVNQRHYQRLQNLVSNAVSEGAQVEMSGNMKPEDRFFHPVILSHVPQTALILEEEIFGPVLPIVEFSMVDEAVHFVNSRPKPLGLYIFGYSGSSQEKILRETTAGGVCINDCAIHFLHHNLPFGGVNNSGIGKSHGYYGFLAFSNEKPVLRQRKGLTAIQLFYPPYTSFTRKIVDWFLRMF